MGLVFRVPATVAKISAIPTALVASQDEKLKLRDLSSGGTRIAV